MPAKRKTVTIEEQQQSAIQSAYETLSDAYEPESTREVLAQAIGEAMSTLEDFVESEDDEDEEEDLDSDE